jgi:hemerythrin
MILNLPPEFATGNQAIDQQHDRIVRLLQDLHDAVVQGKEKAEIGRILASVSVFVFAHFRQEEVLMEATGDPGKVEHLKDHGRLRRKVEDLVDHFHEGTLVPQVFLDFMTAWLDRHVAAHDVPMARFAQGKTGPALQVGTFPGVEDFPRLSA